MIALAIVGIMVAAVAPSLSHVLADNRQSNAAAELIHFLRNARALSVSTMTAMLATFDREAPDSRDLGVVTLRAGMTNRCRKTNWAGTPPVVAVFDMAAYNLSSSFEITLRVADGVNDDRDDMDLCFQPNGDVYWTRTDAETAAANQLTFHNRELIFTVARTLNGTVHGIPRQVLLPLSGNARAP